MRKDRFTDRNVSVLKTALPVHYIQDNLVELWIDYSITEGGNKGDHQPAGLPPHVLRHTFAVTAVQKGISLPSLQRLLGHDRLTTTEIYLNLSPEEAIREFQQKW